MELLLIIAVIMAFLTIKGFYDRKKQKEWLIDFLKNNWGKIPEQEYTQEKYQSMQYYYAHRYQKKHPEGFFLDHITWNDLNLDELFFMMNVTGSAMGEEYLWAMLHELKLSGQELEKREQVIRYFQTHPKERLKIQTALSSIGKNRKISIYEYMDRMDHVKRQSNVPHYAMIALIAVSAVLLCLPQTMGIGGFLLFGSLIYNVITYYKRKSEVSVYYSAVAYLIRMLNHADSLSSTLKDNNELTEYMAVLKEECNRLKRFRKGASAVAAENPTGDPMMLIIDYIRIIFHTDLIRFNAVIDDYFAKKDRIIAVFDTVGFLDAMCAAASFREYLTEYCAPEFTSDKKLFSAEGLYHPFLIEPVPADIHAEKSVLITGSNASGKSTFIKSAAINAILAQTIHTVCAKSYQASSFKVMTSMALTDNLFGNESYYIVEIKSLKRIFDETAGEFPVLCFVDEVLRGTNTVERIAASSRILYSIATANAILFAATHDIELTYMLEHCFDNYHFEEQISEKDISFDYQLRKGRATSQNAIALLGMLGYPEEIIKKARETADHFLTDGEWRKVEA